MEERRGERGERGERRRREEEERGGEEEERGGEEVWATFRPQTPRAAIPSADVLIVVCT